MSMRSPTAQEHEAVEVCDVFSNSSNAWMVGLRSQTNGSNEWLVRYIDSSGQKCQKQIPLVSNIMAAFGTHTGETVPAHLLLVPSSSQPGQIVYFDKERLRKYRTCDLAWVEHLKREFNIHAATANEDSNIPPARADAELIQSVEAPSNVAAPRSATCSACGQTRTVQQGPMKLEAVFFDFDKTLSTPQFLARANDYAVADRVELMSSMNDQEVIDNFGGAVRIELLIKCMCHLRERDVSLFVVSLGNTACIWRHLQVIGLADFFGHGAIFGKNSEELDAVGCCKAALIQQLLVQHGWPKESALFVDDDEKHIAICGKMQVCQCLKVRGRGLCGEELRAIEERAG